MGERLRSGELAKRAGVNVETLRFYERRGLLSEPPRRPSGYREYPEEAVERLLFIKRAQELGFLLGEIKQLLELRVEPGAGCADARALTEAKIADVRQKIRDLRRMERALQRLADTCPGAGSTDGCPILELVRLEPTEKKSGPAMNPVPDAGP